MPRLRKITIHEIDSTFGQNCVQWEILSDNSLCSYVVQQGVAHLLRLNKGQLVQGLLSNLPYLLQRVEYGLHSIIQLSMEYGVLSSEDVEFTEWKELVLSIQHLLKRAPSIWGAERIFVQQALEHWSPRIHDECNKWQEQHRTWPMLLQKNPSTLPVNHPVVVLQGHRDTISGVSRLSSSNCLSWSRDNSLAIWNLKTGEREHHLESHTHIISEVIVDSDRIYTFSWDKRVCIWSSLGELISTRTIASSIIQGAFKTKNGFVFGHDEELYFSDLEFNEVSTLISGADADAIFPVTVVGEWVVTWYETGEFQIWSFQDRACAHTIKAHDGESIRDVLVLDESRFVTWSGPENFLLNRGGQPPTPQSICVWTVGGELLWSSHAHHTAVRGVQRYSEDRLLSWGWDGTLKIWNCTDGQLIGCLDVGAQVDEVLVLKNGTIVFSSGPAGRIPSTLHYWHSNAVHQKRHFIGEYVVSFLEHDDWLLVSVGDGKVFRFPFNDFIDSGVFLGHKDQVHPIVYWDKDTFLTCSDDESVRLWDINRSCTPEVSAGHQTSILGLIRMEDAVVSISSESIWRWSINKPAPNSIIGSMVETSFPIELGEIKGALKWTERELICWNNRDIFLLDIEVPAIQKFSNHETEHLHMFRFPHSVIRFENRLISASEDGTVGLWDVETLSLIKQVKHHDSEVLGVAVLEDRRIVSWSGEWFETVLGDATVRLSDENLNLVATMEGHRSWLGGFCQQGDLFFSWSRDIRVWTLSGEIVHIFEGDAFVEEVRRYGDRLLSWNGSNWSDCTVHLWDLKQGLEIVSLKGHSQAVQNAVLLSNQQVLSWSDEALKLWCVESAQCLETWVLPDQATELPDLVWDSGIFEGQYFSGKGFLCTRDGDYWSNDGTWSTGVVSVKQMYVLTSGQSLALIERC